MNPKKMAIRVARRYLQGGLIPPPPRFVSDVLSWVQGVQAAWYKKKVLDSTENHKRFKTVLDALTKMETFSEEITYEMETESAIQHLPELHKLMEEAVKKVKEVVDPIDVPDLLVPLPPSVFWDILRHPNFLEKPQKRQDREFAKIDDHLTVFANDVRRKLEVFSLDMKDTLDYLDSFPNHPSRLPHQELQLCKMFDVDTRGWKYHPRFQGKTFTVKVCISTRNTAMNNGGNWTDYPEPVLNIFILPFAYAKDQFPLAFSRPKDVIEHESIHLAQYMLGTLAPGSSSVGLPSKTPRSEGYQQKMRGEQLSRLLRQDGIHPAEIPNLHALDDIEFYTRLHDIIKDLKQQLRRHAPSTLTREQRNEVIRQYVGLPRQTFPPDSHWLFRIKPESVFFSNLRRVPSQRSKYQKAIKLLFQAIS